MFGPSPLLWLLFVPLYQAFLAAGPMAGWFSSPGLLRWCGVATAGSQSIGSWEQLLHRGEALGSRRNSRHQKEAVPTEFLHDLCDTANPRAERRGTQTQPSTPAGWIPQGGGRPLLWRFFPQFLIAEKLGPAERPTRLASLIQPHGNGQSLSQPSGRQRPQRGSQEWAVKRSPGCRTCPPGPPAPCPDW